MQLYIAGPMTGIENFNYQAFFDAEEELTKLGYRALNPARHDGENFEEAMKHVGTPEIPSHPWEYYIRRDIPIVAQADGLLLLPGWEASRGARLEVSIAKALSMPLFVLRDGVVIPRVRVIGISGYARSGKDTIGEALKKEGYDRVSFADNIKTALYVLNPVVGERTKRVSSEVINENEDTFNKESIRVKNIIDDIGWEKAKAVYPETRDLLQRLGTEVGRSIAGKDIWVNLSFDAVPDGSKVVVTDCRYPNEADAIKKLGGKVWRVERPGVSAINGHVSETAMDGYPFDYVFNNDGSIESLEAQVMRVLKS
jgi:hypothetical protein